MNKDIKISNIQVRSLIVSTVIGVGVLTLPNTLTNILGKDGWMVIIMSGILMIPLILLITQIFKDNPNKDYFQIGKETLGGSIFTICLLILLAHFIVLLGIITRSLGESVKAFLLPTTPIEIIIILFIIASSYISVHDIDIIARASFFIYPIIVEFTLLIVLLSIPKADFTNVLPLFQSDLSNIPKGIEETFFVFSGFEVILFALPYVEERDKVVKSSIIAMGIVILIYLSIFIMTLTKFSVQQIQRQMFPSIMLAKLIDLPGYFLQNLDGVFMAIWVLVIYSTMGPAYFAAGKILSKIFNTKGHKHFIWALAPIIYWIALKPDNIAALDNTLSKVTKVLGFISVIVVPLLIYIVGIAKRRMAK